MLVQELFSSSLTQQGSFTLSVFFSRKFTSNQLNYSVVEKEALALIWALQHFAVCVSSSHPVIVYTNHNPLKFLNSFQCPNQILIQWPLFLRSHSLDIRHIGEAENIVADALSHAPVGD